MLYVRHSMAHGLFLIDRSPHSNFRSYLVDHSPSWLDLSASNNKEDSLFVQRLELSNSGLRSPDRDFKLFTVYLPYVIQSKVLSIGKRLQIPNNFFSFIFYQLLLFYFS